MMTKILTEATLTKFDFNGIDHGRGRTVSGEN